MEITKAEALAIAEGRISLDCMIFDEATIEKTYGWIFFYGSKNPDAPLAGNNPFMVDKAGAVHRSGVTSAYGVEKHIESFDKMEGEL